MRGIPHPQSPNFLPEIGGCKRSPTCPTTILFNLIHFLDFLVSIKETLGGGKQTVTLKIFRFGSFFMIFDASLEEGNRQIFFIICGKIRAEIVKDHFASWCNCEHASTFLVVGVWFQLAWWFGMNQKVMCYSLLKLSRHHQSKREKIARAHIGHNESRSDYFIGTIFYGMEFSLPSFSRF